MASSGTSGYADRSRTRSAEAGLRGRTGAVGTALAPDTGTVKDLVGLGGTDRPRQTARNGARGSRAQGTAHRSPTRDEPGRDGRATVPRVR